ncbi:hypothetical protein Zmor_006240 [Zophobas morio]|uniref:Tyr recombinase domain-containing protein n=1 Tax=Zophobas morio TaxID=2755281 RepID=A0AA38IUJ3_9CUCU|nr:hypothetical protein Zmor_006240 [Zophobas morio]
MLSVREKIDCSRFHQVTVFLKTVSTGYVLKKSRVFTEDLEKFLDTAANELYLLLKVVASMGIAGGCRIGELVSMSVDDIGDRGSVLVVQIPDTKTYKKRVFTVVNGGNSIILCLRFTIDCKSGREYIFIIKSKNGPSRSELQMLYALLAERFRRLKLEKKDTASFPVRQNHDPIGKHRNQKTCLSLHICLMLTL